MRGSGSCCGLQRYFGLVFSQFPSLYYPIGCVVWGQDDVRRTHRYIARVLHDNPGLKLSMFGIGAEGYLPPAVSVKLEDNIPVPPATPAVPPPPITKPETLAVTPMIPVTPALVSSAPAPNLSRSESATQSVDREPLGDSSEITALRRDLEDATELANARLAELTGLYDRVTFMQQDLEKLKLQVRFEIDVLLSKTVTTMVVSYVGWIAAPR